MSDNTLSDIYSWGKLSREHISTPRKMAGIGGIALTKHGDELCFEESIFLEPEFNAERFVSSCRRRVTLEHLRVDLEAFFKTLKTSLVELINSDYADFVSLSAKLVGPVAG